MSEGMSNATIVEDGEWAGWQVWAQEPFEVRAGPFYSRAEEGSVHCAFKATEQHLNGGGTVHGGCLMTFADFALFAVSEADWSGHIAVTINASCDFVGSAMAGDLVEATGEVVRATKNLLFVRGIASVSQRPVLNFSGIIKVHRNG